MTPRYELTKKLLIWILKAGGIVALSIIAPQLPYVFIKSYLRYRSQLKRRFHQMEKRGWVKVEKQKDYLVVKLEEKGELLARRYRLENLKIQRPAKWDGKWRLVIFDIPVTNNKARVIFREKLKRLGLLPIQKSVYVYPHDCNNEINLVRTTYGIARYVKIVTATKLEGESELKEKFKL